MLINKLLTLWDNMGFYGSQWEKLCILWYHLHKFICILIGSESDKPGFVSKNYDCSY